MSHFPVEVHAGEWAANMLREKGIASVPMHKDLSPSEAESILSTVAPKVLLTGTSWGGNAEQVLRNAARRRGIPSVVVLDFWSNYSLRFRFADVSLQDMPDIICIMDEGARQEMIEEGFRPELLEISGQPHLEALTLDSARAQTSQTDRFMFLSQPDLTNGKSVHGRPLLSSLFEEIGRVAASRERRLQLLFKPHPKEAPPELPALRALCQSELVDVVLVAGSLPLVDVLEGVEVVAGGTTMGLFEARARGIGASAIVSSAVPASLQAALDDAGIRVQTAPLCNGIFDHEHTDPPVGWHAGASARVANIITRIMT
tara:strand:- start:32302 stop:33246 length:945 start_codon:yes stop_codon:yes gene_type:complete